MFNNKYPYTDFHELNLDWVIEKVSELDKKVNELLSDHLTKVIDEYFNKVMIDAIYNEDDECITLKKELIVGDGNHIYSADNDSMTIE